MKQHIILSIILCILASTGCAEVDKRTNKVQPAETKDQSFSSPTRRTSIYRHLSGLENVYPDEDLLTDLCIRKHGFKLDLPVQGIRSARNIELPVSEKWIETEEVRRTEYKTVIERPPPLNEVVLKPVKKRIPYTVTENVDVTKEISGVCVGSEYILE
jgi:hypothetical protein